MDRATDVDTKIGGRLHSTISAAVRIFREADALFERHLLFDAVVDPSVASARDSASRPLARSVRDILAQRWIKTQRTYDQENPKRIYYLSMEFLIGRSLTNNVTNLMLHPSSKMRARGGRSTGSAWSSRSLMPGSATAASDGWQRASSIRWRLCSFRRWGTACATSTACSVSRSRTAGSANIRTTGCAARIHGKCPPAARRSRSSLAAASSCIRAACRSSRTVPRP